MSELDSMVVAENPAAWSPGEGSRRRVSRRIKLTAEDCRGVLLADVGVIGPEFPKMLINGIKEGLSRQPNIAVI